MTISRSHEPEPGLSASEDHNQTLLEEFLRHNDAPCPECDYNLRQLLSSTCPECGQELKLQVARRTTRIGLFLLFVAPMLMLAGSGWLFLVICLFESWPSQGEWGFYILMVTGLIEGFMVMFLHQMRRYFYDLTTPIPELLTGASWAFNVVLTFVSLVYGR